MADEASDPYEREHVTPFVYRRPERFALGGLTAPGIGGILVDHTGWRSIFIFTSLAGLAARAQPAGPVGSRGRQPP